MVCAFWITRTLFSCVIILFYAWPLNLICNLLFIGCNRCRFCMAYGILNLRIVTEDMYLIILIMSLLSAPLYFHAWLHFSILLACLWYNSAWERMLDSIRIRPLLGQDQRIHVLTSGLTWLSRSVLAYYEFNASLHLCCVYPQNFHPTILPLHVHVNVAGIMSTHILPTYQCIPSTQCFHCVRACPYHPMLSSSSIYWVQIFLN